MSEHVESIKQWVRTFRGDVETAKAVVDSSAIDDRARKLAAAALNYLVTRLDLVPDWNETIGLIDDVMVLRVCLRQSNAYDADEHLDGDDLVRFGKMLGDIETIAGFLGDELYGKLGKYCARLVDSPVRGRSPEMIISDEAARKALYEEIEHDILRMPAPSFEDADDIAVRFTSYLHHKLAS